MKRVTGLICVLVLSVSSTLWGRVFLIYAGTPRGGSGDIAANWLMARHLKTLFPKDRIVFAVDERAHEGMAGFTPDAEPVPRILSRLIPGYRPSREQSWEGVEIISVQRHPIPRADYGLAFSMRMTDRYPSWLTRRSRITIFFDEPSSRTRDLRPSISDSSSPSAGQVVERYSAITTGVYRTEFGIHVVLEAGASTGGIYSLPVIPAPPLTRQQTLNALLPYTNLGILNRFSVGRGWKQNPLEGRHIGFSYSFYGGPTQRYIDAMKLAAISPQYSSSQLVLFVRDFPDLEIDNLPPNLRVYRYKSMPFQLHESLMAHSDLPIQVTGNVSMSQAAQYGRIFFPDNASPGNIVGSSIGVLNKMREIDPYFNQSRFQTLFRIDGVLQSANLSSREQIRFGPPVGMIADLILDSEFHRHFSNALEQLRPEWSLPMHVFRILQMFERIPDAVTNGEVVTIAGALDALNGESKFHALFARQMREVDGECARLLRVLGESTR